MSLDGTHSTWGKILSPIFSVTIDRIWNDDRIYRTRYYSLQFTLTHID
jgi:hypothetical protein